MRALLLAAGLGTRLRPLTDRIPKCLVEIGGRPLLAYWFEMLLSGGIERILVNTHHLAEGVRDFVGTSIWRERIDLVHEETLLGTGGTILRNRAFFGIQAFLVAHADNLSRFDVQAFIERHHRRPAEVDITMLTFESDDPRSCGIVVEDSRGVVIDFHEKVAHPPGTRANGAVYIFEPTVLDLLAGLGSEVIDLSTQVLPRYIGRIQTFFNGDYHRDIGNPQSLRIARETYTSADG